MGDIADMMLDGTLCEGCGVYIEGEAEGFPRYCSDECAAGRGVIDDYVAPAKKKVKKPTVLKVNCPLCKKRVTRVGLGDHVFNVHPESQQRATQEVKGGL